MQQMDHANTNCTITLAPAQLWELFTGGHAFSDVPRALLGHKVGAALSGGSAHCRSQLAAQAAGKRTAAHLGQHTSNSIPRSLPPAPRLQSRACAPASRVLRRASSASSRSSAGTLTRRRGATRCSTRLALCQLFTSFHVPCCWLPALPDRPITPHNVHMHMHATVHLRTWQRSGACSLCPSFRCPK